MRPHAARETEMMRFVDAGVMQGQVTQTVHVVPLVDMGCGIINERVDPLPREAWFPRDNLCLDCALIVAERGIDYLRPIDLDGVRQPYGNRYTTMWVIRDDLTLERQRVWQREGEGDTWYAPVLDQDFMQGVSAFREFPAARRGLRMAISARIRDVKIELRDLDAMYTAALHIEAADFPLIQQNV